MKRKETDRLNEMIDFVAGQMKTKVQLKYRQGFRGWETKVDRLLDLLDKTVRRADYLDAAIVAAMLYHIQFRNSNRGVSLKDLEQTQKETP